MNKKGEIKRDGGQGTGGEEIPLYQEKQTKFSLSEIINKLI